MVRTEERHCLKICCTNCIMTNNSIQCKNIKINKYPVLHSSFMHSYISHTFSLREEYPVHHYWIHFTLKTIKHILPLTGQDDFFPFVCYRLSFFTTRFWQNSWPMLKKRTIPSGMLDVRAGERERETAES